MSKSQVTLTPNERFVSEIFGKIGATAASMHPTVAKVHDAILSEAVGRALETLTFREREIIKLRYGIGDGYTYTLEEVGRIFKVSGVRIRQIERVAIRKLQHPVRSQYLEGFAGVQEAKAEKSAEKAESSQDPLLDQPVSNLELNVRARRTLNRMNVTTVRELAALTEQELLGCKNFGRVALDEIKSELARLGLGLKKES